MMTNYLSIIGLSLYMLISMWWKYVLILPFLLIRRRQLIHKFRFAIMGILICYTLDLVVSSLFTIFLQRPSELQGGVEWVRVWLIGMTATKLAIGSILLFFLCRYYETDLRPLAQRESEAKRPIPIEGLPGIDPVKYGFAAAGMGFVVSAAISILSIGRSTSSTAAIGYLFVPMTSLVWSVPFFVVGFSVGYLRKWHLNTERRITLPVVLSVVVSSSLVLAGGVFSVGGFYLSSIVRHVQTMNDQELRSTFEKPFFGRNKFVLGAIALNKNASGELLNKIGMIDDNELYDKMWSVFDVMGENRHGLAVMRLVARNRNALPETLEHLAKSSNDYVLGDVAGNDKTSVETLIRLSERKNYLINWGLARNPSTPQNILSALSRSGDEYTRDPVALNPSTPIKDLELLASDPVWHVRRSVAANQNSTPELLNRLSNDANRNVRQMVIVNKHVTQDILTSLARDSDPGIRQQAQTALERMNTIPGSRSLPRQSLNMTMINPGQNDILHNSSR